VHRLLASLAAGLGLGLALAAPAAALDLPGPLAAFAAENQAACVAMGGAPRVGPAFATPVDLTGDGVDDYIVDLAGIECANAWSAFCGSAGCPVSVWIDRQGVPTREWADFAQAWRVDPMGAEIGVVVEQTGAACGKDAGVEGCSKRLTFAASGPAAVSAPEPVAAAPAAGPPAEAAPVAAEAPANPAAGISPSGAPGWSLREVAGGARVAVSDGPGGIATVALFCLGGQPWLAAQTKAPAPAETAQLEFAFADRTVSSAARREDGAGGALVVELAGSSLAQMLAGKDSETEVTLDGSAQGTLSLKGSTRAIRRALEDCLPL
jgi:hypothetical protein